jgi:uncharacterized protein
VNSAGAQELVRDAAAGPCVPSAQAAASQRPLGLESVQLKGGMWAEWQERNRTMSLRVAIERLEAAGNLDNFRIAAGEKEGTFVEPVFMDSDVYKVLEAIGWELARRPDAGLRRFLEDTTALLERAQEPSGYLNTWGQLIAPTQHFEKLTFSHELYCAGHLIQAAVAAKRGVGYDRLLAVATGVADHLVDVFLLGGHKGIDGHPEIETALVELYRLLGKEAYLDLARQFIDRRGHGTIGHAAGLSYIQDHAPYREVDTLVGHAVRALYLEAGAVDVYLETGDRSLLDASVRHWDDMVATKTSISGGHGSRYAHEAFGDRYELPADRSYNETCAAIASIHWCWRLLLATGEARYADLIERTLYNAFAASTSHDGTRFFYSNLLHRRPDHLDGDSTGRRSRWFSCACCPPNIMRLIASLGHYVATTAGDGLHIHQYVSSDISANLPAGRLSVSIDAALPWYGNVAIEVTSAPTDAEVSLSLRVPSWSPQPVVNLGGAPVAVEAQNGMITIRRKWSAGEKLTLEFDMRPRVVYPPQRVDALRGTAALERGPLVYCLEQVDQGAANVEELGILPDTPPSVSSITEIAGIGRTVPLVVSVAEAKPAPTAGWPFTAHRPALRGQVRTATAIPYFQWDNRDGGAMRIFLPIGEAEGS